MISLAMLGKVSQKFRDTFGADVDLGAGYMPFRQVAQ